MKPIAAMMPFHTRFGKLAWKETRVIKTLHPIGNLPPGSYGLIEFFCTDPKCDCRRVVLQVRSEAAPDRVLATINFGWESVEFYTRWMHGDAEAGRQIVEADLDPFNPQSVYSDALLDLVRRTALRDVDYVDRLAKHYRMFKKKNGTRRRRDRR